MAGCVCGRCGTKGGKKKKLAGKKVFEALDNFLYVNYVKRNLDPHQ